MKFIYNIRTDEATVGRNEILKMWRKNIKRRMEIQLCIIP